MHIDFNSCFATIEQQANPLLRGKPIVVAAYASPGGCILAPSIEAKKMGIKTGMRVYEAKKIDPKIIVLPPDPWKYRNVHIALRKIVSFYTTKADPKSIDEFVLNLEGFPILRSMNMHSLARQIKDRIKREIGEWTTVSIGIAPNRFLAKLASGLHKPDGLDEINSDNYMEVFSGLSLTDLCGIKVRNIIRLNSVGIYSVLDFHKADLTTLKTAFNSIISYYWYLRLRGWEIDVFNSKRSSYGNSFVLPKPLTSLSELSPVLTKLVEKMTYRLRRAGYKTRGVHLAISYKDGTFWHKGVGIDREVFDSREIYKYAFKILCHSPFKKPVRELFVSCFSLCKNNSLQLNMFEDVVKNRALICSLDKINSRWGDFVVNPARMFLGEEQWVPDRIAFGGVKELEEFSLAMSK